LLPFILLKIKIKLFCLHAVSIFVVDAKIVIILPLNHHY
jgi:hypothetical protein